MDGIKVSQLPEASNVGNNDLLMIVQSGISKKVTASKISPEWRKHYWQYTRSNRLKYSTW